MQTSFHDGRGPRSNAAAALHELGIAAEADPFAPCIARFATLNRKKFRRPVAQLRGMPGPVGPNVEFRCSRGRDAIGRSLGAYWLRYPRM